MEQIIIICAIIILIILYITIFIAISQHEAVSNQNIRVNHSETDRLMNNCKDSDVETMDDESEEESKDFFTININDNYIIDKSI